MAKNFFVNLTGIVDQSIPFISLEIPTLILEQMKFKTTVDNFFNPKGAVVVTSVNLFVVK